MKKLISFFVVIVVVAMPSIVEAQYRYDPYGGRQQVASIVGTMTGRPTTWGGGSYRGGVYGGWYDPATLQQMMSLPEGLAACQVDFSTGRVQSCRPIMKSAMAIQAYAQAPDGILGTVHAEKGKLHFRPFDDTNFRVGTGMGGALGAGGGAAIGAAMGNRRGAAIGGVAGAIGGGLLGSRRSHNNCLVIEPETAHEAGIGEASNMEKVPSM